MSSKTKNKQNTSLTEASSSTSESNTVAVLPIASVLETRVPVVLIVGGVGVGKTSVAAAILHDAVKHEHLRVLALVPDVDSFRLALEKCGGCSNNDSLPVGVDVVQVFEEVSGGCVCCTVRRDIEDVLADEALAGTPSFDLVVIDTASSSDPMPVIATLFEEHANEVVTPEVSQSFHLDAVVCVVDGTKLKKLGNTVHEARQIAFADVVVVTKAHQNKDMKNSCTHEQEEIPNNNSSNTKKNGRTYKSNKVLNETRIVTTLNNEEGCFLSGGEGIDALSKMNKSVTLSTSYPPGENNRFCLSASTSATYATSLLPEYARKIICEINPLVQIKELPLGCLGEKENFNDEEYEKVAHSCPKCREIEVMDKKNRNLNKNDKNQDKQGKKNKVDESVSGEVIRLLVGFNTYCAAAFDRLDLSGLLTLKTPSRHPVGSSGVITTVVFAEGRLMQRRFRDCMSALLRLCKENIFRMRGELCYAETEDARWLFHAVHSVVTISESEHRPWAPDEPRVNLLVVTGHDLPISELYACLRMSLIEEAEKSADAMAQSLLAEIEGPNSLDSNRDDNGDGSTNTGNGGQSNSNDQRSKKSKKKQKEKQLRESKELKRKEEIRLKEEIAKQKEEKLKLEREEKLRAKLLEERKIREEKESLWAATEADRRRQELIAAEEMYAKAKLEREKQTRESSMNKNQVSNQGVVDSKEGQEPDESNDYELQIALKASLMESDLMTTTPLEVKNKKKKKKNKNKEIISIPVETLFQTQPKVQSQAQSITTKRDNQSDNGFYLCSNCGSRTREVSPGPQGSLLCNTCGPLTRNNNAKLRNNDNTNSNRINTDKTKVSETKQDNWRGNTGVGGFGTVKVQEVTTRKQSNQRSLASQKWCVGCDNKDCTECEPTTKLENRMEKINISKTAPVNSKSSRPTRSSKESSLPVNKQKVNPSHKSSMESSMENSMSGVGQQSMFQDLQTAPGLTSLAQPPPGLPGLPPGLSPGLPPGLSPGLPPGLSQQGTVGNGMPPPDLSNLDMTPLGTGGLMSLDEPLEPEDAGDNIDLDFLDNLDQADLGELEPGGEFIDGAFEYQPNASAPASGSSRLMGLFGNNGVQQRGQGGQMSW